MPATITTAREQEILTLLSKGLTAKEIATDLFISVHTVESHRRNLVHKLEARNTVHMVIKAIRMGVVHDTCDEQYQLQ